MPGTTLVVKDVREMDKTKKPDKADNFAVVKLEECAPNQRLRFIRSVS